jgi:protein required for attachment to host cells
MKPDWTLIANATRARLLQQEQGAPMVILESFVHPAGPARQAHIEFARELAQVLEQEAKMDHFHSLTIFASSPFLDEIKAELGRATRHLLTAAHELDLTRCGLSELEQRISHEVAMPAR